MNFQLVFAVAIFTLATFVSGKTSVPRASANLTRTPESVQLGEDFVLSCDYNITFPSSPTEQAKKENWELTVAFHKETMGSSMRSFPAVAEFRQEGNMLVFHTGTLHDGVNFWPVKGIKQPIGSPIDLTVVPDSSDTMSSYGQHKCSVTMHLKGSDAKVRYMSREIM